MLPSRAGCRLLLRQDNADLRLRRYGYEVGLISQEQMDALEVKRQAIEEEIERVRHVGVSPAGPVNEVLTAQGSTPIDNGISLIELIRRPEMNYDLLAPADPERPDLPDAVREQVNIEIKYEGYISRQKKQVEQFAKNESRLIPEDIDYDLVASLRLEAKKKLKAFRPASIGQAGRLSGVTPADVSVLLVYIKSKRW